MSTTPSAAGTRKSPASSSCARMLLPPGSLHLFAQRIVPLQPGAAPVLHYEILLRVVDASGRLGAPVHCIAAAERRGKAADIDEAVLRRLLATLARHPVAAAATTRCHVNVSGQSAATPRFRRLVERVLDRQPELSRKLCFELTETASIDRLDEARRFADSVRERGCMIALDDFGSGLSSFAYLKALPVDIVKIDGLFVRRLVADAFDRTVVRAMAEVCHALGKATIAECAETQQVVEALRATGVDAAQGYALHRPCPLEQLLGELLTASRAGADETSSPTTSVETTAK